MSDPNKHALLSHSTPWLQRRSSAGERTPLAVRLEPQASAAGQLPLQPSQSQSLKLSDDHVFDNPPDLVCPITCELFWDPVINSAGQVYERAAIEHHIERSVATGSEPKDPVTNTPLPNNHLTPVFPMRSRAAEYRSSAARHCAAAATSPTCSDPVRYLRRAAELLASRRYAAAGGQTASPAAAAGGGAAAACPHEAADGIPGISQELISFLQTHIGAAYDAVALKFFGNELLRAGAGDAAADVFYRLLLEADDQQQQLEYLELCLACWSNHQHNHSSADSSSTGGTKGSGSSGAPGAWSKSNEAEVDREVDDVIIDKLAAFVERQQSLSMGALIDMLAKARVGCSASQRLCQALLSRAIAGQGPLAPAVAPWSTFAELLLRYIQLAQQASQQQLQVVGEQVEELTAAALQAADAAADATGGGSADAGCDGGKDTAAAAAGSIGDHLSSSAAAAGGSQGVTGSKRSSSQPHSSNGLAAQSQGGRSSSRGKHLVQRLRGCLEADRTRKAAKAALVVTALVGGQHPVWRLLRVAPLMVLLHGR
jgi:hypothetical protein